MRINEVEKPWEKARELLIKYFIIPNDDFTIDNDGVVSTNYACRISSTATKDQLTSLPVKFSIVRGTFTLSESYLTHLIGCPTTITNSFLCNHTSVISLVGGPKIVHGHYEIINSPIQSLDGLPDEINGNFVMTYNEWSEKLPLLRLLNIKGIRKIKFDPPGGDEQIVCDILNKYVGNPTKGNILACAAELTKAGFKENARL